MNPPWLGIYLRGIAMGEADLAPGVSGGTIALITGIYTRLISAIANVGPRVMKLLLRGRVLEAWKAVDGQFLLALAAGIATAVASLATILDWSLKHYPLPIWSAFSGLVLASAVSLINENYRQWSIREWSLFLVGIIIAMFVGLTQAVQLPITTWGIFIAGSVAVCAMILPGISGSFLLLLMGMYQPVISAIVEFEVSTLALFGLGCGAGLLVFSRLLQRLLLVAEQPTMATLFGFLAGSLIILWPWQVTVTSVLDRHGEMRAVQTLPVTPGHYAEQVADPMLLPSILGFIVGIVVVRLLAVLARRQDDS